MLPSCDAFLQQHYQQHSSYVRRWEDRHVHVQVVVGYSATSIRNTKLHNSFWDGVQSLWDEIIEVSTYGPSERKMLKVQRERQKQQEEMQMRMQMGSTSTDNDDDDGDEEGDDQEWIRAFQSAKENKRAEAENENETENALDYDGYALRDLLVSKWGVPLDVDFQRIGQMIYCTILPLVGYGSPLRSRHDTELDYLMHLQGIVEILHKYDNLDAFVIFIETTNNTPKRGIDSVPFRMNLNQEDIDKILVQ
eukprot:CAMPEP_0203675638 /NCGR_PEP_ID=MMETSP0090-20130426/21557_1 /ASSEMBLY_ACC=CAM_ASM_001088 /TAXON_ID=426623 /ORGANISM="Chaetoceros affinis, Strain CCMP159" /LENGTH=249 /DNA_ID=CAMNT_0050541915 /DNA_START=1 /DNA_END=750 /DNA_ORIENTATION=-